MGLPELYLVAAQTFGLNDPTPLGFDGAVEFPPHNMPAREITDEVTLLNREFRGHVYDYPGFCGQEGRLVQGRSLPRLPFSLSGVGQRGSAAWGRARLLRF